MRAIIPLTAALIVANACTGATGSGPVARPSESPAPTSSASISPVASPAGPAVCTGTVPTGGILVLAELTGSPGVVVLRDITDTGHPRSACTFAKGVHPRFISASSVAYLDALSGSASLVRLDLASSQATREVAIAGTGMAQALYDFSPDGQSLTYITVTDAGLAWHLKSAGQDRLLTTLQPPPGRGLSPEDDDFMLRFSPDGRFVAMVETLTGNPSGPETNRVQVRRASDGGLAYSAASGTMGVWSSMPSRLFFRDAGGVISRWDSEAGLTRMQPTLRWVRPRSSPDGRWVGYTVYENGQPHVGLYSVQGDSVQPIASPGLRSGMILLSNVLGWYREELPCTGGETCGMNGTRPSGVTYIYDIAARQESASALTTVLDTWPRLSTGHGM